MGSSKKADGFPVAAFLGLFLDALLDTGLRVAPQVNGATSARDFFVDAKLSVGKVQELFGQAFGPDVETQCWPRALTALTESCASGLAGTMEAGEAGISVSGSLEALKNDLAPLEEVIGKALSHHGLGRGQRFGEHGHGADEEAAAATETVRCAGMSDENMGVSARLPGAFLAMVHQAAMHRTQSITLSAPPPTGEGFIPLGSTTAQLHYQQDIWCFRAERCAGDFLGVAGSLHCAECGNLAPVLKRKMEMLHDSAARHARRRHKRPNAAPTPPVRRLLPPKADATVLSHTQSYVTCYSQTPQPKMDADMQVATAQPGFQV